MQRPLAGGARFAWCRRIAYEVLCACDFHACLHFSTHFTFSIASGMEVLLRMAFPAQ
jgi:hypothetical protein